MDPNFELTDAPPQEAGRTLLATLQRFNQDAVGNLEARTLAVLLSDPTTGETIGGLWGRTGWGYLYVDILVIPDALRGFGHGTRLMQMAEAEAIRRGCHGAWLDTFSFQARGFYERLGYSVFGMLPDYPPGHARYFLTKALSARAD